MKLTTSIFGAALIALSFSLTSCSSNDTTTTPPTTTTTKPGVGSEFFNMTVQLDSNGNVDNNQPTTYDTMRVMQSGITFNGKTNLNQMFDYMSDGSVDTVYVRYEDNGDVSIMSPSDSAWSTYPFGSKQSATVTTSESFLGVPFELSTTTSYAGTENVMVGGKSLSSQKINISASSMTATVPLNISEQVWYAPSIGMITKTESSSKINLGSFSSNTGSRATLQSYTLK